MVNVEEFDHGMNKLINTFGDRYFSEERKTLIYEKFSSITKEHWFKTVDNLILYSRHAPLMAEFSESVNQTKSFSDGGLVRTVCNQCDGWGNYLVLRNNMNYASSCNLCANGNIYNF